MKIIVLDGYTLNPGDLSWQALQSLGECIIYDRTDDSQIAERIGDAEIVLTNKTPLERQIILGAKHLKYIGILATGYNIVDVEAAAEQGIPVCNVPAYSADAVAQFVFALLLKYAHNIDLHDRSVKAGEWTNHADFCYWKTPLIELKDKVMGLIGYGKIGTRVATIAKAFGMKVIVYHHKTESGTIVDEVEFVTLDKLFAESDVISLHIPLFAETKNLINQTTIDKMKDGVVIINTARGPLIDEVATSEALKSGKIGHLAIDVVSQEPIETDNPLLSAPNVTITPHIAWAPFEARVRLMDVTIKNIKAFINGATINQVN